MLAEGINCGLHKIERLMQAQAFRARPRRRGLPKDAGQRLASVIAPNVLDRAFSADRPNSKWIADFTYVWTAEGWLYVAAMIDLFSRRVVGWSMKAEMTAGLVTDALIMAIWRRGKPDALLHHPDQGSQYASEQFQKLMADNGLSCSMSRSGNVWDNAAMESLFAAARGPSGLIAQDRAGQGQNLPDSGRRKGRSVRLYRALLQSGAQTPDNRLSQPS